MVGYFKEYYVVRHGMLHWYYVVYVVPFLVMQQVAYINVAVPEYVVMTFYSLNTLQNLWPLCFIHSRRNL